MYAGFGEQSTAKGKTFFGVVVAGGENDGGADFLGKADERVVEQGNGFRRGHTAVVDVAADEDDVWLDGEHVRDELVEEMALVGEQGVVVEKFAEVPVAGVDDFHGEFLHWVFSLV